MHTAVGLRQLKIPVLGVFIAYRIGLTVDVRKKKVSYMRYCWHILQFKNIQINFVIHLPSPTPRAVIGAPA